MRIRRNPCSPDQAVRLRAAIDQAAQTHGLTGRICGEVCSTICGSCGSTVCQCSCSANCPDALRALSSEPATHPIEPGIVSLVYALTKVGLFAPCWSCEGHERPDGSLQRAPAVWFNCDATVHIRLLADGVAKLAHAGRLNTPWRVVVTFSDPDNPQTTFGLEPASPFDRPIALRELRSDIEAIARAIPSMMLEEGRALRRSTGGSHAPLSQPGSSIALDGGAGRAAQTPTSAPPRVGRR